MTLGQLALAEVVVAVAVLAQAGTGVGFGVVAAPLFLLVAPGLVPGPLLLLTPVVMLLVIAQNRAGLAPRDIGYAVAGCVPGAVAGLWVLPYADGRAAALVVGTVVVVSMLAGLAGPALPGGDGPLLAAGAVGGLLGTVAATPGPPIVLVYRTGEATRYRANLSLFFLTTCAVSLAALAATGGIGAGDLAAGAALLPAVAVGGRLSGPLVRRLPATVLRPAAVTLCLGAGVSLLVRAALA